MNEIIKVQLEREGNIIMDNKTMIDMGTIYIDKTPLNIKEVEFPIDFIRRKIKPLLRLPFKLGKIFIETGDEIIK